MASAIGQMPTSNDGSGISAATSSPLRPHGQPSSPSDIHPQPSRDAVPVGVIALFFLLSPALTTLPMMPKALGGWRWKRSQRAGYVALSLVLVHLVVLGVKGWLAPKGWHGGLPPISLVAAVAALVPLLVKRKVVREKNERKERAQ